MERIIINAIKRERDSDLITTTDHILEEMENNPNFPNPPAELATIKRLLPEYQAAVANAKGRNTVMVSLKKDRKTQLLAELIKLGDYVTLTCNGDRTMLLSSGFPVSGEKNQQPMPVIQELVVELGSPGEVTTRIKRVRGARAYMHQYCTEPPTSNSVWISEGTTNAFHHFKGLKSAVTYWLRVIALGKAGQAVSSPVVSRIIQ